jgi:pentapeptide repeat protein
METKTIGELKILIPDLDPRDLDPVAEEPDEDVHEALVDGASWTGNRLGAARISQSHLIGVDLSDAVWRNVTVYGCRFERVDLSSARLTGTTIERCEFVGCRMTGLNLADATLKNVVFDDCRLDYGTLTKVRTSGPVGLTNCNLTNVILSNCDLTKAAFNACRFTEVELAGCDLRGADLRGNELTAVIGLSSLRGAILAEEQLAALANIAARELEIDVRA